MTDHDKTQEERIQEILDIMHAIAADETGKLGHTFDRLMHEQRESMSSVNLDKGEDCTRVAKSHDKTAGEPGRCTRHPSVIHTSFPILCEDCTRITALESALSDEKRKTPILVREVVDERDRLLQIQNECLAIWADEATPDEDPNESVSTLLRVRHDRLKAELSEMRREKDQAQADYRIIREVAGLGPADGTVQEYITTLRAESKRLREKLDKIAYADSHVTADELRESALPNPVTDPQMKLDMEGGIQG
jgi:hypothetical protein